MSLSTNAAGGEPPMWRPTGPDHQSTPPAGGQAVGRRRARQTRIEVRVKPGAFEYHVPSSVSEAVETLASLTETSEAKLLAGGQSLIPLMNMRLSRPDHLIDLGRIPGLQEISVDATAVSVGSMVTQRSVETSRAVAEANPLLATAVRSIAHFQIRERGTIGGSVAHADPSAELPLLAVVLAATIDAQGPGGARTVSANDFFLSFLTTALEEEEVVTAIRFRALEPAEGWGFSEFSRRRGDFALVAAAATATLVDGAYASTTLGFSGVADVPRLVAGVNDVALGEKPSPLLWRELAGLAAESVRPTADAHASADDRRDLMRHLGAEVLKAATERALRPDRHGGRNRVEPDPLQYP